MGKRVVFGVGLVIVGFIYNVGLVFLNMSDIFWGWATLLGVIFGLLFAYDGYKEAKEINR